MVVANTHNFSVQEAETGAVGIQGQPGYIVSPCLNKQNQPTKLSNRHQPVLGLKSVFVFGKMEWLYVQEREKVACGLDKIFKR